VLSALLAVSGIREVRELLAEIQAIVTEATDVLKLAS
jgi:hypothetical protein